MTNFANTNTKINTNLKNLFKHITNNDINAVTEIIKLNPEILTVLNENPEDDTDNIKSTFGINALMYACILNHYNIVNLLLDNGADVNALSYINSTPLLFACDYNCNKTVYYLLIRGADINLLNNYQCSPLSLAIRNKNYDILFMLLIQNNIDVNVCSDYDMDILSYAIENDLPTEIISIIISKNAKLELVEYSDDLPLNLAVKYNRLDVVNLLLIAGANPYLKDRDLNKNAFEYINSKKMTELFNKFNNIYIN